MEICNSRQIVGYSVDIPEELHFRSRLLVEVTSAAMNGTTVECDYDDGAMVHSLHSCSIALTTEALPPPMNIYLRNVSKSQLEFSWDPVAVTCPAVSYNIEAINCGRCPTDTSLTTATCTDIQIIDKRTCTFGVSTVVCSEIVGTVNYIEVNLEVPDISSSEIAVTPTYDNDTGHLMMLSTYFTEIKNVSFHNSNINMGSVMSYTIIYNDSDTGKSCGNAIIPSTSCVNGYCSHKFAVSSSTCEQANLNVTIFGTNDLGDGTVSNPIMRGHVNNFVEVEAIPEKKSIACRFLSKPDMNRFRSCQITYFDQNCRRPIRHSNDSTSGDIVFLSIDLRLKDTRYCFVSTASDGTLTVNVNGTNKGMADKNPSSSVSSLTIVLSTIFPIILVGSITILGIISVIVLHRPHKVRSEHYKVS